MSLDEPYEVENKKEKKGEKGRGVQKGGAIKEEQECGVVVG